MSRQQTDIARASGVIFRNVLVIVGILVVALLLVVGVFFVLPGESRVPPLLSGGASGQQWTQIGTPPVVYDPALADDLLFTARKGPVRRIEVLDSGLIAGRGLVALESDTVRTDALCPEDLVRLIVADAWEGLYEYLVPGQAADPSCTTSRRPRKLPNIEVCPSDVCDDVDHRGVAFFRTPAGGRIVVADAHQRRLSVRDMNGNLIAAMGGPRLFTGVTALAAEGNGLFYVTTVPSDAERALDQDDPRRTAARLWQVVDGDDAASRAIGRGLERPVGVAYSRCWDRVYVADATEQQTVWFYYEGARVRAAGGSGAAAGAPGAASRRALPAAAADEPEDEMLPEPSGVLSTEAADRAATLPVLQGIAIGRCAPGQRTTGATGWVREPSGGEVFAAGPGGLYVFRPNGTLLARYVLSERIAGLAWGGDNVLYMTIGHRVARLITKSGGERLEAPR